MGEDCQQGRLSLDPASHQRTFFNTVLLWSFVVGVLVLSSDLADALVVVVLVAGALRRSCAVCMAESDVSSIPQ